MIKKLWNLEYSEHYLRKKTAINDITVNSTYSSILAQNVDLQVPYINQYQNPIVYT